MEFGYFTLLDNKWANQSQMATIIQVGNHREGQIGDLNSITLPLCRGSSFHFHCISCRTRITFHNILQTEKKCINFIFFQPSN